MIRQLAMSGHRAQILHRARSQAAATNFGSFSGSSAISANVRGVSRFNSRTTPLRHSIFRTAQACPKAVSGFPMVITPRRNAPAKPSLMTNRNGKNVHAYPRYFDVTNTARGCPEHGFSTFRTRTECGGIARKSGRENLITAGFSRSWLFRQASPYGGAVSTRTP